MVKMMIFIDGTWLYKNLLPLGQKYGQPEYRIDYGKLPRVLAEVVAAGMGVSTEDVEVVRTHLFASAPANYDMEDDDLVRKQREFFAMLRQEFHYETEIYDINFHGGRVRHVPEDDADNNPAQEKCVDVALASAMLYYAALPHAYDIATAVIGDRDYIPALQAVRRLGKRTAIATIVDSCAREYRDPADWSRVRDFDLILLDDILKKLELRYEQKLLRCESNLHEGPPLVWTRYRPRKGQPFYCEACMKKHAEQRRGAMVDAGLITPAPEAPPVEAPADVPPADVPVEQEEAREVPAESPPPPDDAGPEPESIAAATKPEDSLCGATLNGRVKFIKQDNVYAFIAAENGQDYFFHLDNLADGLDWDEVELGLPVSFEVNKEPGINNKAGSGMNVRKTRVG